MYENGKMYVGSWDKNFRHGVGHESDYDSNNRRKGEWKKGKWMRWLGPTETNTFRKKADEKRAQQAAENYNENEQAHQNDFEVDDAFRDKNMLAH